jgi:acetyl coenzyme A synthetase (ADP forming)-like protein
MPQHSLDALFRPRSVAVIGASRDRRTVGGAILHNLLSCEFQGQVFAVNPSAAVVHSLKAYPSVEAIPDPVDLAVIAVPKRHVPAAVDACGRKGVRGVVVITAGYKEVGEAGAAEEQALLAQARRHGMRLVGPNSMGLMNMHPALRLQASFSSQDPAPGNVAFSSQSGALGEAILALLRERGLGLSMFCSLGNKADVSGNDLLEYWEHDAQTRVILMYLESFGNPQKFLQICRRVTRTTPILAVKAGRTAAGARAAASHTGSLAGADTAVESLLAQGGVIRATTIEELFVYASAFATQPVPAGPRVAIVTNSGGPGILATDACVEMGLEIPPLAEATRARMRAVVAPEASLANPVDMIATAAGAQYEACLRAVAEDPAIDAVIAMFTSLEMIDGPSVADGIIRGAGGCGKPVVVCFMGSVRAREAIDAMRGAGLAVYTFPEDAARALAAMVRYRRWLDRPAGQVPRFDDLRLDAIRAVFAAVRADGRTQLTLAEAQRVMEACGVPGLPWHEAGTPDEAAAAAATLGMPVAVKVSSARLVHKSDSGGVRLGLASAEAVHAAATEMVAAARAGDPAATLVVQRMATGGTEVIIGATRDPKFGPVIMFGLGGVFVEVLKDVVFRVHPISDVDATEMVRGIRAFPILAGVRGHAAVDLAVLEQALLRLSQLLTTCPEIAEFDLNPFFAAAPGVRAGFADARITLEG